MIKNLLALLLALQKTTLDADQHLLLAPLGNKVEAISKKNRPNEQDRHNVQIKINDILDRNPTLATHYHQILAHLQTRSDEKLRTLLPSLEQRKLFEPKGVPTLGYTPGEFVPDPTELENIVVDVSKIILRYENPVKASQALLPDADKVMYNQPKTDPK